MHKKLMELKRREGNQDYAAYLACFFGGPSRGLWKPPGRPSPPSCRTSARSAETVPARQWGGGHQGLAL